MAEKLYLFARGSPTRGNNDDRRQWRKQGVAVGAAASKTQAKRSGCWGPQPGLVERSETERFAHSFLLLRIWASRVDADTGLTI